MSSLVNMATVEAPLAHYFDYAATSPLTEEVVEALKAHMVAGVEGLALNANANSLHSLGRSAFSAMESARRRVCHALVAKRPDEIIFTASATEADNTAIIGIATGVCEARRKAGKPVDKPRVITSAIEHDAVLKPCHHLAELGFDVVFLNPDRKGVVSPQRLEEALTDSTVLVSVMTANSETGAIQPIRELCTLAKKSGALFHTDAVQALGKIPIDLRDMGVDAASFSGHKIGAPKGIGVLYLKARTPFIAYLMGGGQELGRRSGTQNIAGMDAFAVAAECAVDMQEDERVRLAAIRDLLYERLMSHPRIKVTIPDRVQGAYLPNIVHIMVEGIESQTLILRMDQLGYCVSGGSACSSGSLESSHVLRAMGVSDKDAQGALRISMGRYTTEDEALGLIDALFSCIR